ncbi:MAG: restriction endonuclease subunit S [Gloeobacterales cyanobacterium]
MKYAFEGKLTEQWREAYADQLESADQLLERIRQERENLYQQQLSEWEEAAKAWEENDKEGKKPSKPPMPLNISPLLEEELVNLPDLPETWCWIKLSVLSERIQIGPFGSLLHRSDYVSNQVPIVNPVHIRNQQIEPDWSLTVTQEKVNELSNYIMYPGDIVMGRRGEMGRCAVITHKESGFLCGSGSLFIRLLPSVNSLFYCYLLGSQRLKNYLSDQSVGTTMQNLNQEIIHNLPVPLCSSIEMQKIVEEVDRRTTLITEVENTIEENLLESGVLRQSILKRAFSGQLVPQDSRGENAAVLLERIRESRRHQEENRVSVPKPRKQVVMKKDLSIIEVLQELNGLATAQDVWRRSKHQEDIEGFYAELKKQINNGVIEEAEELREEKKSYLRLRNEN